MYSDPKASTCTPCGDGISSEPRDLDENPKAQTGSLVRATSSSCCESAAAVSEGRLREHSWTAASCAAVAALHALPYPAPCGTHLVSLGH
jgi:hypothetical protein